MDLIEQKKQLRSKLLVLRKNIPNKQIRSEIFCKQFLFDTQFVKAKNILLYYPTHDEVNILPLLEFCWGDKKNVYLPFIKEVEIGLVYGPQDLKISYADYKEPIKRLDCITNVVLDLIILPGVGFDKNGYRIGHGKGWYDHFVDGLTAQPTLIGVCFKEQLQENIPKSEHDIKMDQVLLA